MRTRDEVIAAVKQSVLRKKIAMAEAQLDWYKQQLKEIET